jgi:hypothetical protein
MKLMFTEVDTDVAFNEWGANCGPHALAAALWLTLDLARALMPDFESRGFTNPSMMGDALGRAGIPFTLKKGLYTSSLCEGINRIQWSGPWLKPGVPFGAAYEKTHWIAAAGGFVYCTATDGFGWKPESQWREAVAKECRTFPRCDGWHITHHYAFEVLAKGVA